MMEPMRSRARIRDVAKAAKVSVGTVSHYLNGRFVSNERSLRIKKAIDDLGFTGNLLAKAMRTQRSSVVGLCVPFTRFANHAALIDALEQRASDAGYEMMQVVSRQDPLKEFQRIERLVAFKVGGILLMPSLEPQKMLDFLHKNSVPTVIVSRLIPEEQRFDQVAVDHRQTMVRVVQEFIRKGHRDLLFLVRFPTLGVTRQRVEGLKQAIEESAQRGRYKVMACSDDEAEFDAQLAAVLKGRARPSGIIFSNGILAGRTISALRRRGITYPKDVSLLTLDNPGWADLVVPRLSYVEQPSRELADMAWRCLAERMQNPATPPRRVLLDDAIQLLDF
jgi:LacI family transcriptional regulator